MLREIHVTNAHIGKYALMSEVRRQYYIPLLYVLAKDICSKCVTCKRFFDKGILLNQSPYRDFRINPPDVPYKYVYIDHLGPINIYKPNSKEKIKVWVLIISCLWSRHTNLKICLDLGVKNFLRSFQAHCFEWGVPQLTLSDPGSQIKVGAQIIQDWIKDPVTINYLNEHGIKTMTFEQYFTGKSSQGSLIEILVKQTKKLLFGAIGKNVLTYTEFEFTISYLVHLINRRPIAFKEALRDGPEAPSAITPELIVKGYHLPSLNLIPELQTEPEKDDPDWTNFTDDDQVIKKSNTLKKVRERIIEEYNTQFQQTLLYQSINKKDRYKPVNHKALRVGDVCLIKEVHTKAINYPMAKVLQIQTNDQNEVTGAVLKKGKTNEIIKRHVNSLILLYRPGKSTETDQDDNSYETMDDTDVVDGSHSDIDLDMFSNPSDRPIRKSAKEGRRFLTDLVARGLV